MKRQECMAWLFDVRRRFGLLSDTLALAVVLFDTCYDGQNLRLYAAACMSVAAKYEEISPPTFNQLGIQAHEFRDMTNMELAVLKACGYCLSDIRHPVWHLNNMCEERDACYEEAVELALGEMAREDCMVCRYMDVAAECLESVRAAHVAPFTARIEVADCPSEALPPLDVARNVFALSNVFEELVPLGATLPAVAQL